MSDPFSDKYWQKEFAITQADLDRIAALIRETQQTQDATTLIRRVVRGRLRYGRESGAPLAPLKNKA